MLKKSLKCCYLQHFAVLALRAYFSATYYGKASGRQNALCAFRSSFCRVCVFFSGVAGRGGWGGGLIAPCLLFQLLANDVHACVCVYIYTYMYIDVYIQIDIHMYIGLCMCMKKQEMKLLA